MAGMSPLRVRDAIESFEDDYGYDKNKFGITKSIPKNMRTTPRTTKTIPRMTTTARPEIYVPGKFEVFRRHREALYNSIFKYRSSCFEVRKLKELIESGKFGINTTEAFSEAISIAHCHLSQKIHGFLEQTAMNKIYTDVTKSEISDNAVAILLSVVKVQQKPKKYIEC